MAIGGRLTLALTLCLTLVAGAAAGAGARRSQRAAGHRQAPAHVRVHGPKVLSRDTPLPARCDRRSQETDTMIAADPHRPRHLVATWDVDDHRSNVTATSQNGGKTWRISTVPGISKCTGGISDQVVDPFVSIGAGGAAYFATLPLSVSGFLVNSSPDGGTTWASPQTADPAAGLTDDLPSVVADPVIGGRAYLTWSRFTFSGNAITGGDARFSRTVDGAHSFSTPVVIDSPAAGRAALESRLVQMSDGSLLDLLGEAPVQPLTAPMATFASRSTDGGTSWSDPVRVTTVPQNAILDPDSGARQYEFCCLFAVAAGPANTAYVAYTKVKGRRSGRVVVVGSTDGGSTWGRPRTVVRLPAQALQAAVAVAGDGTVGVTWYDFRHDNVGDRPLTTDFWFAFSRDHGRTWHRSHLAGPFDLRTSRRAGRPLGVYQGLAGLPHGFAASFIEARPKARHGSEDVFFARITPPRRG
jgi:hypothetical protein